MKPGKGFVKITQTWDGKPISEDWPRGATIIVYRRISGRPEFLILHRIYEGPAYEGDWAWTPPSGARYPGEDIRVCAVRELREETGLEIPLQETDFGIPEWVVYLVEAGGAEGIVLSPEHDRFAWVEAAEALDRCKPDVVRRPIQLAAQWLGVM